MESAKNVKALLVALSLLKHEENHRIQLVLPGKRHRDFDQLEQLAEALKIGDRVVFPGFLPGRRIAIFLWRCRVDDLSFYV